MAKLANTEHAVKCILNMVTWRICTCISRMPPLGSLLGPSPSLQPIPVTAGIHSTLRGTSSALTDTLAKTSYRRKGAVASFWS